MEIQFISSSLVSAGRSFISLPVLVAGSLLAMAMSLSAANDDYTSQLTNARLFAQPLVWVGSTSPNEAESEELWQAAGLDPSHGVTDRVGSLVSFIHAHPESPWTPSLEANLAEYYRIQGRYGQALEWWQKAWTATKDSSEPHDRLIADFTIAYWGQLLASLGRVDELDKLMGEVKGRQMSGQEYQRLLNQTRDALAIMKSDPGVSYRCGTLAMFHVAAALGMKNDFRALADLDSPNTGFSLAHLMNLSEQYHLGLVAVKRPAGSELVVPSVVHWQQQHYAAIVAKRNGLFNVIDPTFGRPQWLTAEAINEDADGYFMVPASQMPKGWQTIAKNEAAKVYGKGLNNGDPPPGPPGCGGGDPASGGGSGGGGGDAGGDSTSGDGSGNCCSCGGGPGGSGCAPGSGMPTWQISEPYISLWLHDKPMLYNMSIGRQFVLTLDYNQRETRPVETNAYGSGSSWQVFNFGPNWNCNYLTYLDVQDSSDTNFSNYQATQYCPDGGVRTYSWDGSTPDTRTFTQLQRITNGSGNLIGFEMLYPNGSQVIFGMLAQVSILPPETLAVITKVIDPQGHTMQYLYNTNSNLILLTNVVDFDGRTNKFVYGNTNYPTAVTQVVNPYSATVNLSYDTNGVLTNLVDVMGISSSFQYSYTNEVYDYGTSVTNTVWLLTSLQTPYGTTTYNYLNATGPLFGDVSSSTNINRAITVTQPDGGHQLYMYRDDSNIGLFTSDNRYYGMFNLDGYDPYLYFGSGIGYYYDNYPEATFSSDPNLSGFSAFYPDAAMGYRNSFYWGPRQYANLSNTTNLLNLTVNDYAMARMRHWLHAYPPSAYTVSPTLNMEQNFSPDGTNFGETIWYIYADQAASYYQGTNDLPSYTAWQVNNFTNFGYDDARNTTKYYIYTTYNSLGHPTQKILIGLSGDESTAYDETNQYIYNSTNNIDLLAQIGPDGVTNAAYSYDANHQVLFMTNALGEVTKYLYNANEQLTSITQPNGLVTTNIYGSDGYLAQQIITGISTNSYTYTNGLVYTHTDERGLTVTNSWDALQRLTNIAFPDLTHISYVYSNLDLARVIDRMGFTNSYVYDDMRRKTNSTDALGNTTVYNYCTCGSLESIQDANGNLTSFYYDAAGRLTNTLYADGYSVNRAYNFYGQLLNTSDSSGNSVSNWYDLQMRLVAVTNTAGQVAAYAYDVDNRITNSVDANGVSVGTTYDYLDRIDIRSYPDNGVEHWAYTPNYSGPTSYTNQITNIVTYAYDSMNRKTNEVTVGVTTNNFAYDGASDLLTLTDGKNQPTSWQYDSYGRVTKKQDAVGNILFTYKYDSDNRLTNRSSIAMGPTVYRYDPVGNLTNVDYSGATNAMTNLNLVYDKLNRLTNLVDGVGTTLYSYDQVGQLLSEDGPWTNDTVSYTYTNRLRTGLSLLQPSTSAWMESYGYDSARRLTSLTSAAETFGYTYDPVQVQRVVGLSLGDGANIADTYDSVARLTGTYLHNGNGTLMDQYVYGYNLAGQRTNVVRTAGDYVNYTYDNMGELTTAVGKESGGVTNRWQEQLGYVYDAAGNLNSRTNNALVQTFTVNTLNELTNLTHSGAFTVAGTTSSGATNVTVNTSNAVLYADHTFASTNQSLANGSNTFTAIAKDFFGNLATNVSTSYLLATNACAYDLNGNLLTNGTRIFAYDDENELTSVMVISNWQSQFVYDGKMRRRIEKDYDWNGTTWVETNEIHFIYDGNVVIQERNSNNVALVTYTRGNDLSGTLQGAGGIGGLLARTDTSGSTFYHADGNGNITMLIDGNQNIVAKYLYDPFGNTLSMSGPLAAANTYRFSSKEWNDNAGLYYYLYRFYDPNLQRWLNRDPLGEFGFDWLKNRQMLRMLPPSMWLFLNDAYRYEGLANDGTVEFSEGSDLYSFLQNQPVNGVDPYGLSRDPTRVGLPCSVAPVVGQPALITCIADCLLGGHTYDSCYIYLVLDGGGNITAVQVVCKCKCNNKNN